MGRCLKKSVKFNGVIERFVRYLDFDWAERRGGVECCQCVNFASSQIQFSMRMPPLIDNWQYWYWQHYHFGNIERRTTCPEATPQSQYKKVRSRGCFAAHLLSVPCAGFGRMVRRDSFGAEVAKGFLKVV